MKNSIATLLKSEVGKKLQRQQITYKSLCQVYNYSISANINMLSFYRTPLNTPPRSYLRQGNWIESCKACTLMVKIPLCALLIELHPFITPVNFSETVNSPKQQNQQHLILLIFYQHSLLTYFSEPHNNLISHHLLLFNHVLVHT